MLVNPIYGAGGSERPTIVVGGSFGDPLGDTSGSITVSTSGHVGETALFIIMHRDDITVDSSWEFVDKRTTVYDSSAQQHISIYKKTIETSAETYTITSTTARMYCTMYYSDKDIDVVYQQTAKMEKQNINGADCAVLQIDPTDEILVGFNSPYTNAQYGMGMRVENGTIIPQYYAAPSSSDLTAARMVSFFTAQKTKIVYYPWDDLQFTVADVFIYGIS